MDKVTIGIPRALHYYYYGTLWTSFLEELGFRVLVSPKTTKDILTSGCNLSNDEMCLSLKIYFTFGDLFIKYILFIHITFKFSLLWVKLTLAKLTSYITCNLFAINYMMWMTHHEYILKHVNMCILIKSK